ncbi:MAG: DUF1015 domain-containing protein [Chloroflexota bacterium]|nr:DUF1015 domain-containing protein [Chloroflexota bacterium]
MLPVTAFRGLSYSLDRYGAHDVPPRVRLPGEPAEHPGRIADVSDVVCPPFDVIGEVDRRALLNKHPRNAVRLERAAGDDPYGAAAAALHEWTADGTLQRRSDACLYYYAHGTSAAPDEPSVRGVVARVLLEPWGARVRPHERTLSGPKHDRLRLLQRTGTQFSAILAIYFDRSDRYRHVMSRSWSDEWRARDSEGILHQVAAVEPDARLLQFLARQQLFVADGHHRYETALAYQAQVREDGGHRRAPPGSLAADWVMAVLVNAEAEDLEVLPTHRLVRGVDPDVVQRLPERLAERWDVESVPAAALWVHVDELAAEPRPVVGLVMPDDRGFVLTARSEEIDARMRSEPSSTAARRLDLSVLHAAIFRDLLGIDVSSEAAGDRLSYTKDADDVLAGVASGEAQAAFIVRPTRLEDLAAVARAADVMPQKSTYFHPKLLTGLVFNPLED